MKSLATLAVLTLVLVIPAPNARADFSQNFQVDTSGWFPLTTDTVNQEPDGYVSPVPYASGVTSASPTQHARLRRPTDMCDIDTSGSIGPSVLCGGPFTRWGGYNSIWDPYTTQVDVYLDVAYARANPDSINGNFCLTTNSSDTSCKGTRFDYSSAINDSSGNFLQDYAFDGGTGNPSLPSPCDPNGGWVVVASTNLDRSGTNIYDPAHDPFCIANSGWYTLKHTFKDVGGSLQVLMEILPAGSGVPLHQWTITPGHLITEVGCNRYGWFANQEIWDLAIDNSIMVGCGTPLPTTTTTTTTTTTSSTTTTTLPDHFQCYEIKPKAFATVTGVSVQDQFGQHTETVRFAHRLCAPANKNGEDPSAPSHPDHLQGHIVSGPNVKVANLTVANQFGTIQLDIVKPDILMVPTLKSLNPLALPPTLTNPTVDHFQCYKAKRSQGSPKFQKILGVKVQDQFGTAMLDLLKPIRLCAPANKRNEDPTAPQHPFHLLCYKTKNSAFGMEQTFTNDQFGPAQPLLIHRRELCVPSTKNGPFPTTTTSTPPTTTTSSTGPVTTTTTSTTTSTTVYGMPSAAFLDEPVDLLD
jgi:hypothetical protein